MKVIKKKNTKLKHVTIKIDGKIYYRNERFVYSFINKKWMSSKISWHEKTDGNFKKGEEYLLLEREYKLMNLLS